MKSDDEREEFSKRLRLALTNAGERADSPTALARGFNRRYPGAPVSVHAARKWLNSEAIPNQDKVRVLSEWLGKSAEWLRFGDPAASSVERHFTLPQTDYELMHSIDALSKPHQEVVRALVTALRRAER